MFHITKTAATRTPKAGRTYQLAGLLGCGTCGRRMQGQWTHGKPYYRCKYPADYPTTNQAHPSTGRATQQDRRL